LLDLGLGASGTEPRGTGASGSFLPRVHLPTLHALIDLVVGLVAPLLPLLGGAGRSNRLDTFPRPAPRNGGSGRRFGRGSYLRGNLGLSGYWFRCRLCISNRSSPRSSPRSSVTL
jgi:hypothetical protein